MDFETLPGTERKLGNPPLVCVPAGVFILSVCLMFPELNMCLLYWFVVCVLFRASETWCSLSLDLPEFVFSGVYRQWDFMKCALDICSCPFRLWSADVLGRLSPHQGTPWGVGGARDAWWSPEIGQEGPSFVYEMEAYPSNSFACSLRITRGSTCLELLVSALCVFCMCLELCEI